MSRGPDAGVLLERALTGQARDAGVDMAIVSAGWTRWASATFTGARHALVLTGTSSPALSEWLASLPEAEFALRGHIVADLAVEHVERGPDATRATIEVLTVEAR